MIPSNKFPSEVEPQQRLALDVETLALSGDEPFVLPTCDVPETLEFLRFLQEEDDAEEQRDSFQYLQQVLDEDRFSHRKIFA